MFTEQEWNGVVRKLLNLSERDLVTWEEGSGVLSCQIGELVYLVGSVDNDRMRPYYFSINRGSKDAGEQLARIETDSNRGSYHSSEDVETVIDELIVMLQARAVRMSRGITKVIQDVMSNLDSVEPPTQVPF